MTKDQYLEMCEFLGNEPKEEEIPIALEDLPIEIEQAYTIYRALPAEHDPMTNKFIGKPVEKSLNLIDLYEFSEPKEIFRLLLIIDSLEREYVSKTSGKK